MGKRTTTRWDTDPIKRADPICKGSRSKPRTLAGRPAVTDWPKAPPGFSKEAASARGVLYEMPGGWLDAARVTLRGKKLSGNGMFYWRVLREPRNFTAVATPSEQITVLFESHSFEVVNVWITVEGDALKAHMNSRDEAERKALKSSMFGMAYGTSSPMSNHLPDWTRP